MPLKPVIRNQLASILILPANAILTVPGILYFLCRKHKPWSVFPGSITLFTRLFGLISLLAGCTLIILTIRDFTKIGRGTLAPWNPPEKLVIRGPYRYVRNPMISGVISVLFGEMLILNTICHLAWALLFTIINLIYIPLSEEPSLEKRFGEDYCIYKQRVPRWIPRLKP